MSYAIQSVQFQFVRIVLPLLLVESWVRAIGHHYIVYERQSQSSIARALAEKLGTSMENVQLVDLGTTKWRLIFEKTGDFM